MSGVRARPPAGLRADVLDGADGRMLVIQFALPEGRGPGLTRAEHRVLVALLRGLSNAAIAREHEVSERTVAVQVARILRKLGFRSRADLAARLPALLLGVDAP